MLPLVTPEIHSKHIKEVSHLDVKSYGFFCPSWAVILNKKKEFEKESLGIIRLFE